MIDETDPEVYRTRVAQEAKWREQIARLSEQAGIFAHLDIQHTRITYGYIDIDPTPDHRFIVGRSTAMIVVPGPPLRYLCPLGPLTTEDEIAAFLGDHEAGVIIG